LPALALCYAWRNFSTTFFVNLAEFLGGIFAGDKSERQVTQLILNQTKKVGNKYLNVFKSELGKEIHALSSASKPVSSWTTQRVVQECREACGGHGYLQGNCVRKK